MFARAPITDATEKRIFKLKRHGVTDKCVIASIDGISDRNQAELLKGTELFAPASSQKSTREQLTGLEARLVDGNVYGRVSGVYNFGAGDIIEIDLASGGSEMIPLNENFISDIEPEEGSLVVHPPEYLEGDKD